MNFNWFRNKKTYPESWLEYLSSFESGNKTRDISDLSFVVFDTETTGLDTSKDRVLSIGAVKVTNKTIDINDSFELYLIQDEFNSETVKIHGILKDGQLDKVSEEEAIFRFLKYIGNSVLVAHHADFDVEMVNQVLKRMGLGKLKNKVIDTSFLYRKLTNKNKHYSLDDLCSVFNISKSDRHTSSGDAYITAIIFMKLIARLKAKSNLRLEDVLLQKKRTGLL